ncbi:MAG: methyltransferase domain-containing protein [Deltaproteobacteria bacterium]|nr:methyltransferase domain-containing protein [Deltaproteobacteria bacterium]MBI3295974.1 methyltransferase domain-containing protein [Deltaproteobacteria bacterium]
MNCRICHSPTRLVAPLGRHPVSGVFPDRQDLGDTLFPLDLYFCAGCGLSQLGDEMTPRSSFREYAYLASFSATMTNHFSNLSDAIVERVGTRAHVVDIGCNDGGLMKQLSERGFSVLGVDPSRPSSAITRALGLPAIVEYFSTELVADQRLAGTADVVSCTSTLQHIEDLHGFVEGVSLLLKEEGLFVVDVGHVSAVLRAMHQVHHEYLTYFWSQPLTELAEQHGFYNVGFEQLPLHGGTLRAWFRKGIGESRVPTLAWETADLANPRVYERAYERLTSNVRKTRRFLDELKQRHHGRPMAAYGASARGAVLASLCGLGDFVDCCVDTTPTKVGRYHPGLQVPIISEADWYERRDSLSLLLASDLEEEILRRTTRYREGGGRFVRLIPEPAVII